LINIATSEEAAEAAIAIEETENIQEEKKKDLKKNIHDAVHTLVKKKKKLFATEDVRRQYE